MTLNQEPLEAPDLILLLAAAPTGGRERDRVNGITRLEKLLFLARQESRAFEGVTDAFEFKPYNYGPYSKAVYESAELLEEAGLLHEERVIQGRSLDEMEEISAAIANLEGVERQFRLTEEGKTVAQYLGRLHPHVAEELSKIKEKYGDMSLRALIRYVYQNYPTYAEASHIRDEVL